jgi:hypothetical protein
MRTSCALGKSRTSNHGPGAPPLPCAESTVPGKSPLRPRMHSLRIPPSLSRFAPSHTPHLATSIKPVGPIESNHPSVGLHGSRKHGPVSARSNEEDLSNEASELWYARASGVYVCFFVYAPLGLIWINDSPRCEVCALNVPDLRLGSTCSLARMFWTSRTGIVAPSNGLCWLVGLARSVLFCEACRWYGAGKHGCFSARHIWAVGLRSSNVCKYRYMLAT